MNTYNKITGYVVKLPFTGHALDVILDGTRVAYSDINNLDHFIMKESRSLKDGESIREVSETEFNELHANWLLTKVKKPFTEITLEKWEDMLEVLPPLRWHTIAGRWNVFFLSEMYTASYGSMFVKDLRTKKCYEGLKDARATDDQHLAEIKKEILGEA